MEGVSGGVAEEENQAKRIERKRSSEHPGNKGKSPMGKKRRMTDRVVHRKPSAKPRLGGSLSDPLNLEVWSDDDECPTCAPSPAGRDRHLGDQSLLPLPQELHHDPLNLEEKIDDFESLVENYNQIRPVLKQKVCSSSNKEKRRKRVDRSRKKSQSESSASISEAGQSNHTSSSSSSVASDKSYNPKVALYRYGNYDRYYSYRNNGIVKEDERLKFFSKDWFKSKDCLDIGSNTGQVTIEIGRVFCPQTITGIDIDTKLVRIASKNLHRLLAPSKLPDGRSIPLSFRMSFGPVGWVESSRKSVGGEFPHNIKFIQGNYVPMTNRELERVKPTYDVILCLSITKWVHLNWGDDGLKRMFQKIYRHLRPGGRFILEPQPWGSYWKRKKLTPEIFENYQKIVFLPDQFHDFLMSSEVGFTKYQFLGVSNNTSPGFRRPLHVYLKEAPPTDEKPHPPLQTSDSEASHKSNGPKIFPSSPNNEQSDYSQEPQARQIILNSTPL